MRELLGEFVVDDSDAGVDASVDADARVDVVEDRSVVPDTGPDVFDAGPKCGTTGLVCCATAPACKGNTLCCVGNCVDHFTDPKNCGGCGHDCRGSACNGTFCDPIILGSVPGTDAVSMVVGPAAAYFSMFFPSSKGILYECDVVNGCPGPIPRMTNLAFAGDVAQTATEVFLADFNANQVWSFDKLTKNVTGHAMANPNAIDVEGTLLFAASAGVPLQSKVNFPANPPALNGGAPESAVDIVASGNSTNVFWTRSGASWEIRAAAENTTTAKTIYTTTQQISSIAADGANLVWVEQFSNGTASIMTCPANPNSCTATQLASGLHMGSRMNTVALVGPNAYFTSRDGASTRVDAYRCPIAGCNQNPATIAFVPVQGGAVAGPIVRDAQGWVYFLVSDQNGTRIAKAADLP